MIDLDRVQGHWIRDWIKAPGFEDHTTRVHWMQAGSDYADVRIPLDRPELGEAQCLADLSPNVLQALAQAEGFAGHVTLEGDRCTWHREVNWHGTPEAMDVGALSFDAKGRLIEAGVLADYTELWAQNADQIPKALRFCDGVYSGLLVVAGDVGLVGIGRTDKPATKPILDALESGVVPDGVEGLFDGVHALCKLSGSHVIATLATDPFVESHPILTLNGDTTAWHRVGFDGSPMPVALRNDPVPA